MRIAIISDTHLGDPGTKLLSYNKKTNEYMVTDKCVHLCDVINEYGGI